MKPCLLAVALLIILSACATGPQKRLGLVPVNTTLSTEDIEIKALPLSADDSTGIAFFDALLQRGFLFIRLSIHNRSDSTVIYNTSHTFLFAGVLDYKKPVDITDLYFIIRDEGAEPQTLSTISGLKKSIFDASTRIRPSEKREKFLLFRPLAGESRGTRAVLGLNQLYIGTRTIDVKLLFRVE